jgi:hypothetical protein
MPRWSTSQSLVEMAGFEEEYDCDAQSCLAAYDGLHPGTLGKFQIVRAFAKALSATSSPTVASGSVTSNTNNHQVSESEK